MKKNTPKIRINQQLFAGLLVSLILWAGNLFPAEPIMIPPDTPALFVDDYWIESHENLQRTLHQPVKDFGGNRPVIALENEFGDFAGTLEANGTIVYDPRIQKFVMFALGFSVEGRATHPDRRWEFYRIFRFTSADGLNWVKGDDGTPQIVFPRSPADLLDPVSGASATNVDQFSCWFNPEAEYPYQAWQHFANWGADREGVYLLRSRDGIFWERRRQVVNGYAGKNDPGYREIRQNGRTLAGPGDVTLFAHDPTKQRFLGIFKFYRPEPLPNGNRLRSRAYAFLSSPKAIFDISKLNRIALLPPATATNNDQPSDEYYGSTAWRYGSRWLGELKVWHERDDYPWSAAGCAFLKLVVSHDGLNWAKVPFRNEFGQPEVFLGNGPEGGNHGQNDGGYMTMFSQGPLRIGDELLFYYGSSSFGKNHPDDRRISGGGIFRARLRVDGFVSVDSGTFTTRLLQLQGTNLFVNAAGTVEVSVLDVTGKQLGSATVTGDALRHQVVFEGKSLKELSHSSPVRLRFTVEGKLYSFTVSGVE